MQLKITKEEVVLVLLEWTRSQGYCGAMRALERDTGVCLETHGRELSFIRSLILDGRWSDAEKFIEPLKQSPKFDYDQVLFELRRQKFLELLDNQALTPAVMELVDGLKELEGQCSQDEFNTLCYCLTLGSLKEHKDFKDWTPEKGRLECFEACAPYFEVIYGSRSNKIPVPQGRLLSLLRQSLLHQMHKYADDHPEWEVPEDKFSISLLHDLGEEPSAASEWTAPVQTPPPVRKAPLRVDVARPETPEPHVELVQELSPPAEDAIECAAPELEKAHTANGIQRGLRDPSNEVRRSVCEEAAEMLRDAVSWTIPHDESKPVKPPPRGGAEQAPSVPQSENDHGGPVFDEVDQNHDGVVTREEWDSAMPPKRDEYKPSATSWQVPPQSSQPSPIQVQEPSWHWTDPSPESCSDPEPTFDTAAPVHQQDEDAAFNYSILVPSDLTPTAVYQDTQAVRAVTFDSTGELFLVGTNSKSLVVCSTEPQPDGDARVLEQRAEHHFGSIYCVAWRDQLIASGSNDKLVRILRLEDGLISSIATVESSALVGHTGTVRCLQFVDNQPFLVSAGAGDCAVKLWDVERGVCMSSYAGHIEHVYALCGSEQTMVWVRVEMEVSWCR
eukprot:TRINITY_DN1796_c0_g1_i4.p1 TRINITY_DN1796_c0_g1~~TRINITY_DN1796_c0_g1_i4.p1  ORF type:complete len:615 (-),score=138.68 TRINITY_DN1796_c0_g1_i4:686-2530(-)